MSFSNTVRLNKFISESGHCSRREADRLIESNRVKINGKPPELGSKVGPDDIVTVDGMEIAGTSHSKKDRVYLAYNKPVGITCTTESNVKGNIVDAVDHDERIFPIGRLDKPSEGLILLTSDGDIVNKILRAENSHDKEYLVTVNKSIGPGFAEKMSSGIPILGTVTKPCKVVVQGKNSFKITLTQGLNRQIRRMCDYLGYDVVMLQRTRIMNIQLGKLRSGQWRNLTHAEMEELNTAIADSSGEAQPKSKRAAARSKAFKSTTPADRQRQKFAKEAREAEKNGRKPGANKPGKKKKKITDRSKSKGKPAGSRSAGNSSPGKNKAQTPRKSGPAKNKRR